MKDEFSHSLCYCDTNIFVYMHDDKEREKREISNLLYKSLLQTGNGRISVQVISEWRNTMIKKFSHFVSNDVRRKFIRILEVLKPLAITPAIILKADELCDSYSFSPYDAIHVQSALEQNCQYFLSEDMQDGLVVQETLTIRNPYKRK